MTEGEKAAADELLQQLDTAGKNTEAAAAQTTYVKGLIERLSQADKKFLAQIASEVASEPSKGQVENESYRRKVADMNSTEFEIEKRKLR